MNNLIQYHCAICSKPIVYPEAKYVSPKAYHMVCKNHIGFENTFIKEFSQKQLGIITNYPETIKNCFVCNHKLSDIEMDYINERTLNIVCPAHIDLANLHQVDLAKHWFKYKIENPLAMYEKDTIAFHQWLIDNNL